MADRRPNLVVVLTDHGRADSVGAWQCGIEVTPNANALARRGWRATRCYTPCPLCGPARTALATGRAPWNNGVACNEFARGGTSRCPTLHERLAAAGYDLAHVGVHHVRTSPPLRDRVPFALWADFADHAAAARAAGVDLTVADAGRFKTVVPSREVGAGEVDRPYSNAAVGTFDAPVDWFLDLWLADRAAEFVRSRGENDRPFALFVNLWAPHPPLVVPEPWASMFDPADIDLPANVGRPADGEPPSRRRSPPAILAAGVDDAGWRRAWAAHLGLTRLADDATGRVLAAMDAAGLAGSTLVALASDHGEHLGQHAMYQKMELYEPALRVPLVVAGPGVSPGRTDDGPCSLLDLAPTLLEAAGADPLPDADGRSLWPALSGGSLPSDRAVAAQYGGNFDLSPPPDRRLGVVTDRWKFVHAPGGGGDELYDLRADPLEMTNLAGDPRHAGEVRRLRPLVPPGD